MFWTLEIPFKTGFIVSETVSEKRDASKIIPGSLKIFPFKNLLYASREDRF
jgi:hypothetical protein